MPDKEDTESLNKLLVVLIKGQAQNKRNITATAELVVMQADRITFLEKQNKALTREVTELKSNKSLGLDVHSLGDILKLS